MSISSSPSNFLDRFEELGLSRNEASVYLALLTNHPVTGYKLAKDSGILRPVVYEMLTRLVERGGVKLVKGSPEQYSPIPPENFLASLEKRFNDAKITLSTELSTFNQNTQETEEFWTIVNKDAIISNSQDMVLQAKEEVLFYINNPTYALLLKDVFSKKVASGVQVLGFSYRDIKLPGTDLYSYKIEENLSHAIIDDERIIIVVDKKNSIIADMDAGKACQSMRPAQVTTATENIKSKIVLYRLQQILPPSKLELYLFEQEKSFFNTMLK